MATNKEIAEGYRRTAFNYIQSHDMKSSDAEQFMNAVETRAQQIENSGIDKQYTPAKTAPTPNIFNRYVGKRKEIQLADAMWNDFATKNNLYTQQSRTISTPTQTTSYQTTSTIPYVFDWTKGLQRSWIEDEEDSLTRRIKNFATEFENNLNSLVNAYDNKQVVHGADATKQNIYKAALNQLKLLLQKPEGTEYTRTDLRNLAKIVNDVVGPDAEDLFNSYFDGYMELSDDEKAMAALKKQGYNLDTTEYSDTIKKYLKTKGYKVVTDGTNKYLIDNSGKLIEGQENGRGEIFDLNTGTGLFQLGDGTIYIGSIDNIGQDSNFYSLSRDTLEALRKLNDDNFTSFDLNSITTYSKDPLVNTAMGMGAKSILDVSKLFRGTNKVIAFNLNGQINSDRYGRPMFDDSTIFITIDNGKIVTKKFSDMKSDYKAEGFADEPKQQIDEIIQMKELLDDSRNTFDATQDYAGRSFWNTLNPTTPFKNWRSFIANFAPYFLLDNVEEDPQGWANDIIAAYNDGNVKLDIANISNGYEFLKKLNFDNPERKKEIAVYIYNLWKNGNIQLTDNQKKIFNQIISEAFGYKKEGGILYAAKGTTIIPTIEEWEASKNNKRNELLKEAQEKGYGNDVYKMQKNEEKLATNFSAADTMRLLSLGQDVASVVTAFLPGAGTAASAGLGITSMGTDFIADMIDEGVSAGQMFKNLGTNAAFAALGMVPGAKVGKVVKQVIKWAPRLVLAYQSLGLTMDESMQKTFKKIGDGNQTFNKEDWRNVSEAMKVITAGIRAGKFAHNNYKGKKVIDKLQTKTDDVILKGVKRSGKDVTIKKSVAEEVKSKLSSGTEDDLKKAKKILKDNGLSDSEVADAIKTGKKYKIAGKQTNKLVGTEESKGVDEKALAKLWNVEAEKYKNSNAVLKWFGNFGGGPYTGTQRGILNSGKVPSYLYQQVSNPRYNRMVEFEREPKKMTVKVENKQNPKQNISVTGMPGLSSQRLQDYIKGLENKGIKIDNISKFKRFIKRKGGPKELKKLYKDSLSDWANYKKQFGFNQGGTLGRFNNYLNSKQ